MKNDIKREIERLEEVAEAMDSKNFLKAYKNCRLVCDIYYKPVDIIERQLHHNITYDVENGTDYARQYALHLIVDAKRVLHKLMED